MNMGWIDISPEVLTDIFKKFDGKVHRPFRVVKDPIPDGAVVSNVRFMPESQAVRIWFGGEGVENRQYTPSVREEQVE